MKYYSKKKRHHKSRKYPYRRSEFKKIHLYIYSKNASMWDGADVYGVDIDPNPILYPTVSNALVVIAIQMISQYLIGTDHKVGKFTVYWEVEDYAGKVHSESIDCDFSEANRQKYIPGSFSDELDEYVKKFILCYVIQVLPVIKEYKLN